MQEALESYLLACNVRVMLALQSSILPPYFLSCAPRFTRISVDASNKLECVVCEGGEVCQQVPATVPMNLED
jgi:hypothetical protein